MYFKKNCAVKGFLSVCFVVLIVIFMSSCAQKGITTGEGASGGIATEQVHGGHAGGRYADGTGEGVSIKEGAVEEDELAGSGKRGAEALKISEGRTNAPLLPIYFDFDKYNIRKDMVSRLEHNARYLLENPSVTIQIQGNCDERGTNEYNIALGEKRANSAKQFLVNMGVEASRIDTVSFGEERPLYEGHGEEVWAKNRRDDFVIK